MVLITDVFQWIDHLCSQYSLYGEELQPVVLDLSPDDEYERRRGEEEVWDIDLDDEDPWADSFSDEHPWSLERNEDDEDDKGDES